MPINKNSTVYTLTFQATNQQQLALDTLAEHRQAISEIAGAAKMYFSASFLLLRPKHMLKLSRDLFQMGFRQYVETAIEGAADAVLENNSK